MKFVEVRYMPANNEENRELLANKFFGPTMDYTVRTREECKNEAKSLWETNDYIFDFHWKVKHHWFSKGGKAA